MQKTVSCERWIVHSGRRWREAYVAILAIVVRAHVVKYPYCIRVSGSVA